MLTRDRMQVFINIMFTCSSQRSYAGDELNEMWYEHAIHTDTIAFEIEGKVYISLSVHCLTDE